MTQYLTKRNVIGTVVFLIIIFLMVTCRQGDGTSTPQPTSFPTATGEAFGLLQPTNTSGLETSIPPTSEDMKTLTIWDPNDSLINVPQNGLLDEQGISYSSKTDNWYGSLTVEGITVKYTNANRSLATGIYWIENQPVPGGQYNFIEIKIGDMWCPISRTIVPTDAEGWGWMIKKCR